MKVLLVEPGPNFSVADVCTGLHKGLKACGVDVRVLNLSDRLTFFSAAHIPDERGKRKKWVRAFDESAAVMMAAKGIEQVCYEWWPDVVVLVSGMFVPAEVLGVLALRPHHVVLWCTESPYEDDRQGRNAGLADSATALLVKPS